MTEHNVIIVGHLYDNQYLKGMVLWLSYERGELVLSNSIMTADEFTPLEAVKVTREYVERWGYNVLWGYLEPRPRNAEPLPPNIQRLVFPK